MALQGTFTLTTNATPPLALDVSSSSGEPSLLGQWLQPRIEGTLAGLPVDYAPYGAPNPTMGTIVLAVLVGLVIVGAISAVKTFTR